MGPTKIQFEANKLLKDRTIKYVRWLSKKEAKELGWTERAIVLELDDGTCIYPGADAECNRPGVLMSSKGEAFTIPTYDL